MTRTLRAALALLFSLLSFGTLADDAMIIDHQLIRHFTDRNDVVVGKVIIQVTRPGWTAEELMDHLPKTGKSAKLTYEMIQKQGYLLVYGVNGRKVSRTPLCEIAIDGESVRYKNCDGFFPGRT